MSLSVSRLVRVAVNLSPTAAQARSFSVLNVAGDSDVISGAQRYRTYTSLEGVVADFGTDAPEYDAAALYFGQTPKPKTLMISRWFRTAASAFLNGGVLTAAEQLLSIFTGVTSGGFKITIDGTLKSLTGLDFSGAANLNAVAAIIDTALTGASCIWDGAKFIVTSATTGLGAKASGTIILTANPSYGVRASGTVTIATNPNNGDTTTINGTVVTFVTGTPSGNQVLIAGTAALTAANLQTFLQNSADTGLAACTYNTIGAITTVTARVYGTAGNSIALLTSSVRVTVSGATLAGGVAADTLTVNGTAVTFVAVNPTGNQVLVGATSADTAANLRQFLTNSTDSNIELADYYLNGLVITVTYSVVGIAGNSFTLVKSSTAITLSGAVLSGGVVASSVSYAIAPVSGTDISAILKLTSSLASTPVTGYDAETPVAYAAIMANLSANWYGLTFAASVQPTDDQYINVADFIEGLDLKRNFGVTIQDSNVLDATYTADLASRMKALGYHQSFNQYSSSNAYAVASFFGRAFAIDFNANLSTIDMMYKQEPLVTAEDLTETQATTLQNKRCNAFVDYVNDTMIIQYGVMSGPVYFDETYGLDWFQNAVQTDVYNLLYTSATKIPQTDSGINQIVNAVSASCERAVNNGLVAPGYWNADGFGQLARGDFLKVGYYIYATPLALQSQGDREARKSPPIQVAIKLAGSVQTVDVLVNVNR